MVDEAGLPAPNPYAPPVAEEPTPPVDAELVLTREEVEAFVVKKGAYYWKRWSRATTGKRFDSGFNGAAFFFSLIWLLYRRMYRHFWISLGLVLASSALLEVVEAYFLPPAVVQQLDRILNFAVGGVFGTLGNGLYLTRARAEIAAARRQEPDPARRAALLATRGGTSWLSALIGVLLTALAIVASVTLTGE